MLSKENLREELESLLKAKKVLEYSFERCKKIKLKFEYTDEELSDIEAFTSRFARISDIIIQKNA